MSQQHYYQTFERYSELEVVTADERRACARSLRHEEALEQPHQWPYPHIHLAEVDEDGHQSDGVGRKMLQLEPVVLQQREEGGQRRHQPHQGVRREEDEVPRPHVGQRRGPALHLARETGRLPPHQPSQAGQGAHRLEPRGRKLSGHGGGWWSKIVGEKVQRTKEMGAKAKRMGVWIRTHGSTPIYPPQ
jgi:hypothetical protein